MEIPVIQNCNRCGECCVQGGACVFRPLAGLPYTFNGRCEILTDIPDGTRNCYLIDNATKDDGHLGLWASQYIDGNCSHLELRKEINASV